MPARCPRDKETRKCMDPGCNCTECDHGTCGCESYAQCGDEHRKQDRIYEQSRKKIKEEDIV